MIIYLVIAFCSGVIMGTTFEKKEDNSQKVKAQNAFYLEEDSVIVPHWLKN